MTGYAELQITSNFSFLRGGSHPRSWCCRRMSWDFAALALTDRNTLAGVVRAHVAAKEVGIRFVVGARLDLEAARIPTPSARILPLPSARGSRVKPEGDKRTGSEKAGGLQPARSVLCFPTDRAAYGRLSQLISPGAAAGREGRLQARARRSARPCRGSDRDRPGAGQAGRWLRGFPQRVSHKLPACYLAGQHLYRGDDAARLEALAGLAATCRTPLLATDHVLYHGPERRPLQDVLTCIREHATIDRRASGSRPTPSGTSSRRRRWRACSRDYPDALARTLEIADACRFTLDELRYDYPSELRADGHDAGSTWPADLAGGRLALSRRRAGKVAQAARARARADRAARLRALLPDRPRPRALRAAARASSARAAGSAANSAVCYCLGITAVDPERVDLLFERFVSAERDEPPDIDVDFEHERREEVIQYIYQKYGRDRAGMAATSSPTARARRCATSARRWASREDMVEALGRQASGARRRRACLDDELARERGLDPTDPRSAARPRARRGAPRLPAPPLASTSAAS